MYTVSQLARLTRVSVRTLHHYDTIGLLRPTRVGENGYRFYDQEALARLQQVLFYREMGLALAGIRDLLDAPDFDRVAALKAHRKALDERMVRLSTLVQTIDRTLSHLEEGTAMSDQDMFTGFTEEQQAAYEEEAAQMYDPAIVRESNRRWKSYSKEKQQAIMAESGAIYQALVPLIGSDPAGAKVQALIGQWHQNMRNFYEPTPEILRGLGQHYVEEPRFAANFARFHPDLAAFMRDAIAVYVERLT